MTQHLAARVAAALQKGDRLGFARGVKQLISERAPLTRGWKSLAQPLVDYGEFDLARKVIDLYALAAATPAAEFERALLYVQTAKPREALALLDRCPSRSLPLADEAYLRGTIALNLGDRVMAREALVRALNARPQSGQIYQTLSMLGPMDTDDAAAELILSAEIKMQSAPEAEQAGFLYALGKTLDDLGEWDRAFAAFARGAAIIARQRPYDRAADRSAAEAAISGWNAATIDAISRRVTVATDRAIIVTGLPRSGSTLVEQILVSHSQVVDGDELGRFTSVVNEIGGPDAGTVGRWAQTHDPTIASRHYLHVIAQRFGAAGFVVDKTLEASRYLGVLAAIMPDAPIVWMRRNPLDNAWSCFSTWFLVGLPWSWDLNAMAQHFALEDRLLRKWQGILGDRIQVVDYEHLATNKDIEIPAIMAHVRLPVEPGVFTPEKTQRLVTTASVSQVRAPINTRAIGRARPYESRLAPFSECYNALGGSLV